MSLHALKLIRKEIQPVTAVFVAGNCVDEAINNATKAENLGIRTVYCDAKNEVTVIQSYYASKIMSIRKGAP